MPPLSELRLIAPTNSDAFERLCYSLFKAIWEDPATKINGRRGQSQQGVDIYGRPQNGTKYAGVQCKVRHEKITEKELRTEVEEAKTFSPQLSQFILATTAQRDASILKVARAITDEHVENGLFTVDVWSWDDILLELAHQPHVVKAHYPEQALTATIETGFESLSADLSEIKAGQNAILSQVNDATSFGLASVFDGQLDFARQLIRNCKPGPALEYLENQRTLIWSQSSDPVKGRLLSLTGYAKLALGDESGGAELLIESHQYAPDEGRSRCNCALGHLLKEDRVKAAEMANQVLATNAASSLARSIAIQTLDLPLEEIIAQLPTIARNDSQVAFAVAHVARQQGNLMLAEEWYRTACNCDVDDQVDPKAMLGQVILEQLLLNKSSSTALGYPSEADQSKIVEAIQLLTSAWEKATPDPAFAKARLPWLVNRGVAHRFLRQHSEAAKDFETVLQYDHRHTFAIHHLALEYYSLGRFDEALELATEAAASTDFKGADVFIAEILLRSKGPESAIGHLTALVARLPKDGTEAAAAQQTLIEFLTQNGDLERARAKCDVLLGITPNCVEALAISSQIYSRSAKHEDASAALHKARQQIDSTTPASHIVILADEAYRQKNYEIAAFAYERIATADSDNPFIRQAIRANLFLGRDKHTLELCESIKAGQGATEFTCEVEASIYERRGQRVLAQKTCEEWLNIAPDDGRVRIRLAQLSQRLSDFAEVDSLLDSPPAWQDVPKHWALVLADLMLHRDRPRDAIKLLYDMRRVAPDADVENFYIYALMLHGNNEHDWIHCDVADVGSAVCLEVTGGQKQWFILENRRDSDSQKGEISPLHPLFAQLKGKKKGDAVTLHQNDFGAATGTVIEIQSKYVRALQESMQRMHILYPDETNFRLVHIPNPDDMSQILEPVARHSEQQRIALNIYREQPIAVSSLGRLIGVSVIRAWWFLHASAPNGLHTSLGTQEERDKSLAALRSGKPLLIDAVAIMTITQLGFGDLITKSARRLGITQSTLDIFQQELEEQRSLHSNLAFTLDSEGERVFSHEVTEDERTQYADSIASIIEWAKQNCEIIPIPLAVDAGTNGLYGLPPGSDQASAELLITASAGNHLLYSDDVRLREFALRRYNVPGVWTQAVLLHGLKKHVMCRSEYENAIIQLARAGHTFTTCDYGVIATAAAQANWQMKQPFVSIVATLGEACCETDSAVSVIGAFVYDLLNLPIVPKHAPGLVMALLDAVARHESSTVLLGKIVADVSRRFIGSPNRRAQAFGMLKTWAANRSR